MWCSTVDSCHLSSCALWCLPRVQPSGSCRVLMLQSCWHSSWAVLFIIKGIFVPEGKASREWRGTCHTEHQNRLETCAKAGPSRMTETSWFCRNEDLVSEKQTNWLFTNENLQCLTSFFWFRSLSSERCGKSRFYPAVINRNWNVVLQSREHFRKNVLSTRNTGT